MNKKLKLNAKRVKDILTREEMKRIVGGFGSGSGSGSGSANGPGKFKCCPKGKPNSPECSDCVDVPAGQAASCEMGVAVSC